MSVLYLQGVQSPEGKTDMPANINRVKISHQSECVEESQAENRTLTPPPQREGGGEREGGEREGGERERQLF